MKRTIEERLKASLRIETDTGCHVWTGCVEHRGHGRMRVGGRKQYVHRLAYELARGPIPDGAVLDHLCRNPPCCNPDHLEAVSVRENNLRGIGVAAVESAKTHCPQGHAYDEANTWRSRKGHRFCRACRRAADRQRYNAVRP